MVQVARVNAERMRANAIEAAEQCGILALPEIAPPIAFARVIAERDAARWLVFCDEDAEVANPAERSPRCRRDPRSRCWSGRKAASPRTSARRCSNCRMSCGSALGPRILRADTAAVAALALVQAVLGDWR